MGVVVVVVSKKYLLNDHTLKNIFNFHNNAYIIVQGGGGIKGVGSRSSNRISLYALALACSWILFMLNTLSVNKCGGLVGPVDTHSPILPADLMKLSEIIWNYPAISENIWKYLKIFWWFSEIIWNYLKLSETIRHCVKKLDTIKN